MQRLTMSKRPASIPAGRVIGVGVAGLAAAEQAILTCIKEGAAPSGHK